MTQTDTLIKAKPFKTYAQEVATWNPAISYADVLKIMERALQIIKNYPLPHENKDYIKAIISSKIYYAKQEAEYSEAMAKEFLFAASQKVLDSLPIYDDGRLKKIRFYCELLLSKNSKKIKKAIDRLNKVGA